MGTCLPLAPPNVWANALTCVQAALNYWPQTMTDHIYTDLAALGVRLHGIESELVRLAAEKAEVQSAMRELATRLVQPDSSAAKTDAPAASPAHDTGVLAPAKPIGPSAAIAADPPASGQEVSGNTSGTSAAATATASTLTPATHNEVRREVPAKPKEPVAPWVPARQRQFLQLLRDNPQGDAAFFARAVYHEDSRKARINVSANFSLLKTDGCVESLGAGRFRVTEKGLAALTKR